jgi:hypothetical protein
VLSFKKQTFCVFLTLTVFLISFLIPVQKASAFTSVDVVKASKIIRALGEKIGVKWTSNSLAATVGYILADDTPEGLSFVGRIPIMDGQIKTDDLNYEDYLLEPTDWKNGVKLIDKASKALVPNAVVPFWGNCAVTSTGWNSSLNKWFVSVSDGSNTYYGYSGYSPTHSASDVFTVRFTVPSYSGYDPNGSGLDFYYWRVDLLKNGNVDSVAIIQVYTTNSNTNIFNAPSALCNKTVVTNDSPNVTNINTTIINNIDNSVTTNYQMPITVPVADNTDVTIPINQPVNTSDVYPPDKDGDGIPDDRDSTPDKPGDGSDGSNPFASLVPILFLIKLFGLLGACLSYMGRLLAFVMTIPVIPSKTIDNPAFQWFKSAQIVGIQIYTVVSSLASVGMSFLVYRVIRRLF